MPKTRHNFRYWSQMVFVAAISAITAASSVDAAPYDIVVKGMKTKIRIGGYDYSLEGRLFRPEGEGRFPLVILMHGSCGKRCRRKYPESRLASPAIVFARSGYAAYTFNRIGYGNSDGFEWNDHQPFERTGGCSEQNFMQAARDSGLQIRLVIEALTRQKLKYVEPGKILAVGQSGGGLAVFGLTEGPKPHGHLAGLRGVISTAGNRGASCAQGDFSGPTYFNENMVEMYKTFGRVSKTPALMVYAINDPRTVRAASWRDAYNESGGKAKLVVLPELGSSPKQAHSFFSKEWSTIEWKPHFNAFLSSLGLPELN
ncbi:MAG: hypothetical protein OXE44_18730 [Nitrospinae bacterium]|nr:hypothetical protein [Nitrospinota bacterium]